MNIKRTVGAVVCTMLCLMTAWEIRAQQGPAAAPVKHV